MFKAFTLFIVVSFCGYSQDKTIEWINKNAYELNPDSLSSEMDFSFLTTRLKGKNIIGLGEASHGTHEFFVQKSHIIQYLIRRHNYRLVAFESTDSAIVPINNYLQNGKGDLKQLMRPLALYNTVELYKLFQWLKLYNQSKSPENTVTLVGFDSERFWNDGLTRDKLMAEAFIKAHKLKKSKAIIWAHNVHIAKDTTMAKFKAMGSYLKEEFNKGFYVIGFDTYQGIVNVLEEGRFKTHTFEGKEHTFSSIFQKAGYRAFFLPFNTHPNPLLGIANLITNIYSNWQEPRPLPIRPGVDFDGLIFIRETTASIKLN